MSVTYPSVSIFKLAVWTPNWIKLLANNEKMFFCSPEAQSIEMNKSGGNTHWINASLAYAFPYKQIWEIDADIQCQSNDTVFYFRVLILVKAGVCQGREQAFVYWTSVEIFMILYLKMIDLNHYMRPWNEQSYVVGGHV